MSEDRAMQAERGPEHIQDFIFLRELSEVYLLLDHVSGHWEKSLPGASAGQQGDEPLTGPLWVKQVCQIGWPPQGNEVEQADQASILLAAKDRLNAVAKPATGATIAFTLLVAGEDNAAKQADHTSLVPSWMRWSRRPSAAVNDARGALGQMRDGGNGAIRPPGSPPRGFGGHPPSRTSLARMAYPGLVSAALWFRWEIRFIIAILFAWLVFTCFLSWNVAAGRAILARVEASQTQYADIAKKIAAAENASTKRTGASAPLSLSGKAASDAVLRFCDRPRLQRPRPAKWGPAIDQFNSVDEMQLCAQLKEQARAIAIGREDFAEWMAIWKPLSWVSGSLCHGRCLQDTSAGVEIPHEAIAEQWGAVLMEVLAAAVLPLCYGLLGAGAAVVRDLWGKMRDSLLSPRDLTLALGQLALGAVIGACIGLFITPTGAASAGANGITAPAVLSASALSFIGGFGVEGVFVALESLVKRVFNISDPAKAT